MRSLLLSALLLALTGSAASATTNESAHIVRASAGLIHYGQSLAVPQTAERSLSFSMSEQKAAEIFGAPFRLLVIKDFPVAANETRTIEIRPTRSITDANTQWYAGTSSGRIAVAGPEYSSFRGTVQGEAGSNVFLTYTDGELLGIVERGNGIRYVMAPTGEIKTGEHLHILSPDQAPNPEMIRMGCDGLKAADFKKSDKEKRQNALLDDGGMLEVSVAVEANYDFFARTKGSSTATTVQQLENAQRYVAAVFAMVSRIYEDEVNTTFYLPYVNIWTDSTEDPYRVMQGDGSSVSDEILADVGNYWNQNLGDIERNVAHVLLGKSNTGNGIGGIAWPETLCDMSNSFSLSGMNGGNFQQFPTLAYTWDVSVIAHEIGHNFGSPHTHTCDFWDGAPQGLDTCVSQSTGVWDACTNLNPRAPFGDYTPMPGYGSLMSYCHLEYRVALSFFPIVARTIRQGALMCLPEPVKPLVKLQSPLGKEIFASQTSVEIRWTSLRVNKVVIEYSTNGGADWDNIATANASDRKAVWNIPSMTPANALVRIYDVTDQSIADTSLADFSIRRPLTLEAPLGGERLGQRENLVIKWASEIGDSVRIEYSVNGSDWTFIEKVTASSGSHTWKTPANIASKNVQVRVVSVKNNQIRVQSSDFEIGVPRFSLTALKGGEEIFAGKPYTISWISEFVSRVNIQYSTNGGQSWANVNNRGFFRTDSNSVVWNVPANIRTENALIQVLNYADKTMLLTKSDTTFSILTATGVAEDNAIGNTLHAELSPNPVRDEAVLHFRSAGLSGPVYVDIVDEEGSTVAQFTGEASTGSSISLDLRELAQGAYSAVISQGDRKTVIPVRIVR